MKTDLDEFEPVTWRTRLRDAAPWVLLAITGALWIVFILTITEGRAWTLL